MATEKLSAEDQARVDKVVQDRLNSVERKPFRPGLLLGFIVLMMILLGGLSYFIAWFVGAI